MESPAHVPHLTDDEGREAPIAQGTLRSADGVALPLERTTVEAVVRGPVAEVTVCQRFHNDRPVAIEAVYLFPLPPEAAVHKMLFRIGERVVDGVVKEKDVARREYETALAEGRAATLLEEDRPALFTLSVANIAPGAHIEVELVYQDLLPYDDGRWRFIYPMVAPGRYLDSSAQQGPVGAPRRRDEHRPADVEVTVRFVDEVHELRCTSHMVAIDAHPQGGTRVRLRAEVPVANRDFALDWRAAEFGVRPWIHLERPSETAPGTFLLVLTPSLPGRNTERLGGTGDLKALRCGNCGGVVSDLSAIKDIPGLGTVVPCAYCGAVLAPGTDVITRPSRPRDVLVLVDRSASMRGAEALVHQAVEAVLAGLAPGDAAQVLLFDHDRTAFDGDGGRFLALSPELIARARKTLEHAPPRGGTELEDALAFASKLPQRPERTRVVVLVSDVAVGNEGRLLRRLPELLGVGARLFVLVVGPSANPRFAARLARAGGGAMEHLAPGLPISEVLARFARRVREAGPVLTDLALWWEGSGMSDLLPASLPDLHSGEALRVLGHFTGTGPSTLVLTGTTVDGKPYRQELHVVLPVTVSDVRGLERAWARRRVEDLAERVEHTPDAALHAEGLRLALAWSIVSRWTSLVAEDRSVCVARRRMQKGMLLDERGDVCLVLDGDRKTVGQLRQADLRLTHPSVSPLHAEFSFDGEHFVVRDLASVHGIRVNGVAVREARILPGAILQLGEVRFHFAHAPPGRSENYFEFVPTLRAVDAREGTVSGSPTTRGAPGFFGTRRETSSRPASDNAARVVAGTPPRPAAMPVPPMVAARPVEAGERAHVSTSFLAPPSPASAAPTPMPAPGPLPPRPMAPTPARVPMSSHGPPPPAIVLPSREGGFGAPSAPVRHTVSQGGVAPGSVHVPLRSPRSEPYPEQELRWLSTRLRGELDLAFVIDATGSMGAHIAEVRARLLELVDALRTSPLCRDLRLAVVAYRDHPPQESTFVTSVTPFTTDVSVVCDVVAKLEARGGGDGPEAVTDGLYDLVRLPWRPGAAKAAVWFGDAPPHGIEPSMDAFPQGCPCGHHWYTQAESLGEMGVTLYAIGCLPTLHSYVAAEAMYRQVARTTRGMFLPLRDASLLVPLIAGAVESALDGQRIDAHLEALLAREGSCLHGIDEDERIRWVTARLRAEGVKVRAMEASTETAGDYPLRFREVTPIDLRASFARLIAAGRWTPTPPATA